MLESTVHIHGAPSASHFVKIIDKSKRAFSVSLDSTRAFEMTLQQPDKGCGTCFTRFRARFYSLWLLLFKHHGKPPSKNGLFTIFFIFAALLALDCMLLVDVLAHIYNNGEEHMNTVGVTFVCIYPGVAILGPLFGVLGSICGSPGALKLQSSFNACCVLVNYPLTIFMMVARKEEDWYIAVVVTLWLNKIGLSFFGAKVRQHLINPLFEKNVLKSNERYHNMVSGRSESLLK